MLAISVFASEENRSYFDCVLGWDKREDNPIPSYALPERPPKSATFDGPNVSSSRILPHLIDRLSYLDLPIPWQTPEIFGCLSGKSTVPIHL